MEIDGNDTSYTRFVSHQLKSPINAIQSLLKTVTEGYAGDLPPQAKYAVAKAISRAEEASGIVSDLLDFEQYSREGGIHLEEINIITLIESLVKTYAVNASEKEIFLQTDVPFHERIFVRGDEKAIEHAVKNLIENAIKYTPEFGNIFLELKTEGKSQTVTITLRDTGDGIPADEMEKLFTPFFRSKKHKNSKPGTGLGLAIVKKIIDSHDGTIRAESKEEEGTAFYITLPFVRMDTRQATGKPRKQVIIIGGVTSGPKAASRLRRIDGDVDITIVEEREFLSYAGCELPLYLSSREESSSSLITTPYRRIRNSQFFQGFKQITTLNTSRARSIDRNKKEVMVEDLRQGRTKSLHYDSLVLATGTKPYLPGIPGIDNPAVFTVYSLEDAKRLKQRILREPAGEGFVIGGGLIGATLAQALLEMGVRITIIEKKDFILNAYLDSDMARKLEHMFSRKGIRVLTGREVKEIQGAEPGVKVTIDDEVYHADFVLCSAGVVPRVELAESAGLETGPAGGIKVNERFQSSDPDIYAIGDCAESPHLLTGKHEFWPLGSVSTKMGRMAADIIGGKETRYSGSLGTTMFKCFDLTVARTGLTREQAEKNGFSVDSVVVTGTDKPKNREDSGSVFLKVCCDVKNNRLLGAQGIGVGEVAGKISLLAACISREMKLDEIFSLDLGYAPDFTLPIDISQTACAVLQNKRDGLIKTVTCDELSSLRDNTVFVSINPSPGRGGYIIPGSLEISPEQLREGGLSLEKDTEIVLYCTTSALAYQAYRYLRNEGYSSLRVMEGGYLFWEK